MREPVADLLQRGLVVRIAEKPFTIGGTSFPRGSVVVRKEGNPDDLAGQVEEVARRWQIQPVSVSTSRSEDGPDLGGVMDLGERRELLNVEHAAVGTELAVHVVGVERPAKVIPPSPRDPEGKAMRG